MAMPFPAIQQLRTPPVGRPHPHPMTTTAASAAGGSYSYPEHYDAHRGSQSSLSLPHNTTTTPQIPTYARIIRIFGFIPVLFLIILIGISYYGVVFVIYTRILERGDRTLVGMACHLVMYHVLLALVLVSFGRTVWTHPGSPIEDPLWFEKRRDAEEDEEDTGRSVTVSGMPKEFSGDVRLSQFTDNTENMTPCAQPPSPLMHASLPVAPVDYNRQRRYCRKCRLAKPDRAHHCSICHRCILKMDHHCPWVNTCVGHRNYKYFVLFTVWTAVYCLYTSGTSLATAVWAFRRGRYPVMPLDANLDANLSVAYCILAGGLFGIFLAFFSGFHIHLVLKNKSTIENMDGSHLRSLSRSVDWKGGGNVFDLGRRRNWEQVFGESKWLWLLPVASSLGDGFTYPLNTERYRRLPSAMDDPAEVGENRI